jgi:rod shape-determining protein MreD
MIDARPRASHGGWIILLTLLVAFWLSILPMPEWARWARPEWVALVVIYWVIALPHRMGVGMAWLTGLALDLVEGAPLGENALALAVIAYLALILYQRLRMYVPWQQSGVVFVLVGIDQLLCHWVQTMTAKATPTLMFLLPALVSALLWPSLFLLLRFLRRRFQVA